MSPRTRPRRTRNRSHLSKEEGKSLPVAKYGIIVERTPAGSFTATVTRLDRELQFTVQGDDEAQVMRHVGETMAFYIEHGSKEKPRE